MRQTNYQLIILCVVGIALFSNTTENSFHLDDYHSIREDTIVHNLQNFNDIKHWLDINYRPLSKASFAVNYHFDGEEVQGYHWVNIIVHILTTVLVFFGFKKAFDPNEYEYSVPPIDCGVRLFITSDSNPAS